MQKKGRLNAGGTIIEATAGNTGLGLALVAAQKGYRLILIIPDKMSADKVRHLRALGAEIVLTRSDVPKGHPEYYQDMAERMVQEIPGAFWASQFDNPANPKAHEEGTGPEIWEQMDGDLDAFVAGVGSGGTISGVGRFLKSQNPKSQSLLRIPRDPWWPVPSKPERCAMKEVVAGRGDRRGLYPGQSGSFSH